MSKAKPPYDTATAKAAVMFALDSAEKIIKYTRGLETWSSMRRAAELRASNYADLADAMAVHFGLKEDKSG